MAQYANYWSCSKFAKWLSGTPKPEYGTAGEWRKWHKTAKTTHPIRYWLAEVGLHKLQDFVYWPYNMFHSFRYYINNRWVVKSNALTAHPNDIKPGNWQDVGYRFLPCLFNELVNFVEVEQAWHNVMWDKEKRDQYCVPWWRTNFLRWRTWRCPEAGVDYLDWASKLTNEEWCDKNDPEYGQPTPQALAAMEIKELYTWWKEVYPNRPDPYEVSGWSELCDKHREDGDILSIFDTENETPASKLERNVSHKKLQDIEAQYEQEEDEMLIRLIKIRRSLWT
jgi:hypothetical protein